MAASIISWRGMWLTYLILLHFGDRLHASTDMMESSEVLHLRNEVMAPSNVEMAVGMLLRDSVQQKERSHAAIGVRLASVARDAGDE